MSYLTKMDFFVEQMNNLKRQAEKKGIPGDTELIFVDHFGTEHRFSGFFLSPDKDDKGGNVPIRINIRKITIADREEEK